MPLNVVTSNKMEVLLGSLSGALRTPLASPFTPEIIVVQSKGMQRWISMELSKQFGVWANTEFPFPNRFINDLFRRTMPDVTVGAAFQPEVMCWNIFSMLESLLELPAFACLKGYLQGHSRQLKLYQLSGKIADTFDQYTIFRSDLLADWEAGREDHWQALLWRELCRTAAGNHRAEVRSEFLRRLAGRRIDLSLLPARLSIFGVSYLPLFHVEVMAALARHVEVSLYVLSPCSRYWADILPGRALSGTSGWELYPEDGHALLAALGKLGRDFSGVILDLEDVHGGENSLYQPSGDSTLLEKLQTGLLELGGTVGTYAVAKDDRSIALHVCHSPMREVEVLHDQILAMLDADHRLEPRDILVMTPDIETYAPYINAVFDGIDDPNRRIPYSIADRSIRHEGVLAETVLAILALTSRRFEAPLVMDILQNPAVQRKFGLDDADVATARQWVEETAIRWGMDARDRVESGLPEYDDHSWKPGLERLVLGYAMPEEGCRMFAGILPYDNMEGSAPVTLGKFIVFVRHLSELSRKLKHQRGLPEWSQALTEILQNFFEPDSTEEREALVLASLALSLADLARTTAFRDEVSFDVFMAWLQGRLALEQRGLGFMAGGVTFCAMLPMRSIPFKVIAMIGMNDGSFPRQNSQGGFDLIAASPRKGDRSLRDEDRYLFLENILSARGCLYISYLGRSIRDNSVVPPSVLVSELQDHLANLLELSSVDEKNCPWLTVHRLQAFNPEYFRPGSGLFSYSPENCIAGSSRVAGGASVFRTFTGPLTEPPHEMRTVTLNTLLSFYKHPAAYIVKKRLGIRLDHSQTALAESEPFDLDGLEAYSLKQELVEHLLHGGAGAELMTVARARGILSPGRQGQQQFDAMLAVAESFTERLQGVIGVMRPLEPLDVDLTINGFRVNGRINGLRDAGLVRYRPVKIGGKDVIALWLEHLVLNRVAGSLVSRFEGIDGSLVLEPLQSGNLCLEKILELYWQGLSLPLQFFPKSSLEYIRKGSLKNAGSIWDGYTYKEKDDPYYRFCFGDTDPIDDEFAGIASSVFDGFRECASW